MQNITRPGTRRAKSEDFGIHKSPYVNNLKTKRYRSSDRSKRNDGDDSGGQTDPISLKEDEEEKVCVEYDELNIQQSSTKSKPDSKESDLSMKRKCLNLIRQSISRDIQITPTTLLPNGMSCGQYACNYVLDLRIYSATAKQK